MQQGGCGCSRPKDEVSAGLPERVSTRLRRGHSQKDIAMTAKPLPAIDILRKNFVYNAETGEIRRVKKSASPAPTHQGYICFTFCGKHLQGHRVAWALYYGSPPDPSLEIDHINGIRDDNRISNLRLVARDENLRNKNMYKNCKHGYPGIVLEKNRKRCWRAQIGVNGTLKKIGSFRCKTAAIVARKQGEVKYGYTGRSGGDEWQV